MVNQYFDVLPLRPEEDEEFLSLLEPGDIIYEQKAGGLAHAAIITGWDYLISYDDYMQTIEAVSIGVSIGYIDSNRLIDFRCTIVRVKNATAKICGDAINFCFKQLDKPYSFISTRQNSDVNSTEWYCSELVWAAYYNQGIDLDGNGIPGVMPWTLRDSDKVTTICSYKDFE